VHGDYSLDPAWKTYWKQLVADGHVFGSHTFDHVLAIADLPDGKILVKPQFGANAGKNLNGHNSSIAMNYAVSISNFLV